MIAAGCEKKVLDPGLLDQAKVVFWRWRGWVARRKRPARSEREICDSSCDELKDAKRN
jgi:hypothetical protein